MYSQKIATHSLDFTKSDHTELLHNNNVFNIGRDGVPIQ